MPHPYQIYVVWGWQKSWNELKLSYILRYYQIGKKKSEEWPKARPDAWKPQITVVLECLKVMKYKRQADDAWDCKQEAGWIIRDVLMHSCCDVDAMISASGIGGITCNPSQITSQGGQEVSAHQPGIVRVFSPFARQEAFLRQLLSPSWPSVHYIRTFTS